MSAATKKGATNKRIGKLLLKLKLVGVPEIKAALRIQEVRRDIGEHSSLDQILFENGEISAESVFALQDHLQMRIVHCQCGAEHNVFKKKPGSNARCGRCKTKIPVPGNDPEDPFRVVTRADERAARDAVRPTQGGGSIALGLLFALGIAGVLGGAAHGSWGTEMGIPAAVTAAVFLLALILLGRKKQFLTASALGLLSTTALVVLAAARTQPDAAGLNVFGATAHQLLAPLVLLHVAILVCLGIPLLKRVKNPWLFLILFVPLSYALLFFVSRCVPGVDMTTLVTGPDALERVPWYLHPGQVTFLVIFPIAALSILFAGIRRRVKNQKRTLMRDSGLVFSMLVLSAFGLGLATLQGKIPSPDLEAQVAGALGGRTAGWMLPTQERSEVAVAATKAEADSDAPEAASDAPEAVSDAPDLQSDSEPRPSGSAQSAPDLQSESDAPDLQSESEPRPSGSAQSAPDPDDALDDLAETEDDDEAPSLSGD